VADVPDQGASAPSPPSEQDIRDARDLAAEAEAEAAAAEFAEGLDALDDADLAPSVVAVVVVHDAGPWLEEGLRALDDQDYEELDILVIDAGSSVDPTERIAAACPDAFVHHLGTNPGFGPAANAARGLVEGASFYLLCHDDVALQPGAISALVAEAYRTNSGVVGPKLVRWGNARELLQVGMGADKLGNPEPFVDAGEFDQEQHDAVRDVFFIPGGATLVRADLFDALGGFDPGIDLHGEDLDLCWRAHVAGARVSVAPTASARHVEALGERRPEDDRRRLQTRHRLRTVLSCYSAASLLRILPQALFFAVLEVVYALVVGRGRQARDIAGAWFWNLRRLGQIRRRRKQIKGLRRVEDREVRALQARGNARLGAFLRGQSGREGGDRVEAVQVGFRNFTEYLRSGPQRSTVIASVVIGLVLLVGSRHLITRPLPLVGEVLPFPDNPLDLVREWASGWRSAGLGSEDAAPTAFGMLGGLGVLFLGAMGILQKVLVLGMVPLGLLGAWRLLRSTGSAAGRTAALLAYAAVPLPYNALAEGHWRTLGVYAATPWILDRLARASGLAPFGPVRGEPGPGYIPRSVLHHLLALGLLTAVLVALAPVAIVVPLIIGVGLALGAVVAGQPGRSLRVLVVAVGAVLVAFVLHVPWSLDLVRPGAVQAAITGVREPTGVDLADLLRFETGPWGAGALSWLLLPAAALPLLIGRGWRLGWGVRGWLVAIVTWGVVWSAEQGWFGIDLPTTDVLLAPAAAGLALAVGMGATSISAELAGSRFGTRQVAVVACVAALALFTLPALGAAVGGRWDAPRGDVASPLGFFDDEAEEDGPFRVLWLGDPEAVPLAGWNLGEGVEYATSEGLPTVQDDWSGSDDGATGLVADALESAEQRETSRLGRLLGPMGIRYVVVPMQAAPVPYDDQPLPIPEAVVDALGEQLDLEEVEVNPGLIVYRNEAWAPTRTVLADGSTDLEGEPLEQMTEADVAGSPPALPDADGYAGFTGEVEQGEPYLAAASSSRWSLRVDGEGLERSEAFGWANGFASTSGGDGSLSFATPATRYGVLLLQLAGWALLSLGLLRRRLRTGVTT
jgi:GT2 family glycosyltransferase